MQVDLTTARKGDAVKFRCGGESTVSRCDISPSRPYPYRLLTDDFSTWRRDGRFQSNVAHPFDIVEIVPKAFDWAEVKPGDAFTDSRGEVWLFTAFELWGDPVRISDKVLSCQRKRCLGDKRTFIIHQLTRCPQHDIEVQR